MSIKEGHLDDVDLSGLKFVSVAHFPDAMHEGNGQMEVYVGELVSERQRAALFQILGGKAGGPIFEILAAVCPRLEGVHFVPIEWELDKEKRRARLTVPGFGEPKSEPLMVIPTGGEQRVIVKMPDGLEYKEMEVAQAAMLKSNGAIKFEWQKTHSSLAEVEQTDKGLVA